MSDVPCPQRRGFTLMELLIVLGIISILSSVILVAIQPGKQMSDVRDAQRRTDVNTIMNAVHQYTVDTGKLPGNIPMSIPWEICRTGAGNCTGLVDLILLAPQYYAATPMDPQANPAGDSTKYTIVKDAQSRVTVAAPNTESGPVIQLTR